MTQVAILAGGLATRLRSVLERTPKSMVEVAGEPFLAHQLRLLHANDVRRVVLCVGHLGQQICDYAGDGTRFGVQISYSCEGDRLLGTAGALKLAERLLDDSFFVMNGDSYLRFAYQQIMQSFLRSDHLGLMVVHKNESRYDRSNVRLRDGFVESYDKSGQDQSLVHIDAGLVALRRSALELLPAGVPLDMGVLYGELIQRRQLVAYETDQRFYEVGSVRGLEEFRRIASQAAVRTSDPGR